MSGPSDVLAVLDRLIGNARTMAGLTGDPRMRDDLREGEQARQAVAKLLEADREYDAAYAEFPRIGAEKAAIERAAARISAAGILRSAALAGIAVHSAVEPQQDPDHAAMLRDSVRQTDEPGHFPSSPASEETP